MVQDSVLGRISVAPKAIATVASEAVLGCYGVVGMAAATLADGIAVLLQVENQHRGVEVEVMDGEIAVDLYVIVEYGTRISEVAHNIMETVSFALERALGMRVRCVNVHVQGLRVSDRD